MGPNVSIGHEVQRFSSQYRHVVSAESGSLASAATKVSATLSKAARCSCGTCPTAHVSASRRCSSTCSRCCFALGVKTRLKARRSVR